MVVLRRLLDVPGGQRQHLHVLHTVELQHVHVVAAAVVFGDEAAFTRSKHVLDDFAGAYFVVHAEKHCDPITGHILGVFEELQGNT